MTLMVTWLWQGAAMTALTLLALRMRPRLSAATRHRVWWFALGAVLLLPVAHLMATMLDTGPPAVDGAGGNSVLVLPAFDNSILVLAAILWTCIAVLGLVRVIRGWRTLSQLKQTSTPFDAARETKLQMWSHSRMSGRRPQLRTTGVNRPSACALGLGTPAVILVSRALSEALDDAELDDIVMHERAHLERRDDWLRLLQAVASSLVGLHPAVRFITRQIDLEREAACDDLVVARADARRYARSLILAAEASAPIPTLAPAAVDSRAGRLRFRIVRLLDPGRNSEVRPHLATSMACAIALMCALLTAPQLTPLVVFTRAVPPASAARLLAPSPDIVLAEAREIPGGDSSSLRAVGPLARTLTTFEPNSAPVSTESSTAVASPTPEQALLPLPLVPVEGGRISGVAMIVPPAWPPAETHPPSRSEAALVGPGWSSVATSATEAAVDVARTAESVGDRATNAGLSIGRIATRVGVGLASRF